MVWAAGSHPLRATDRRRQLFKNEPPGRTTMDNYTVIFEFPDDIRCSFTQLYFDPPGFSGTKERVFGSKAQSIWLRRCLPSAKSGASANRFPGAGQDPPISRCRVYRQRAREEEAAQQRRLRRISTLTAMLGRKSIYERAWFVGRGRRLA